LDFSKDVNLNTIYYDLLRAVHERAYEKRRPYGPIRHMNLGQFCRVLEEIGLAAWHGDGRTTTVREIEEHCHSSGVGSLLNVFQEGAQAGVTRLLAAFFFRRYGERASGDPTFVFTHKSFGEYLAARRIVRAIERVNRELKSREKSPDEGWDEREALKHWAQICGSSALSQYLHSFLLNELTLRPSNGIGEWQKCLSDLFTYMLRHGMPMEKLQIGSFKEAMIQSRNAEESLLAAMNGCARLTKQVSAVEYPGPYAFGTWFKRIQGQRLAPGSNLVAKCLSFLDLRGGTVVMGDFWGANLEGADLRGSFAYYAGFYHANLEGANLGGALFIEANLRESNLTGARLEKARLQGANLQEANLERANLERADLEGANLERADLQGANLQGANLESANLDRANLEGANLDGAKLRGIKGKWLGRPARKTGVASRHGK
jgi:uncharacterized protein YjbI with pentapeptide repeats